MKKTLLSLFCVSLLTGLFAQSFSLSDTNGVVVSPGSVFRVIGDPSQETIYAYINITNNSAETKSVSVKKVIHEGDTLAGTRNTFCWGICYSADVYISPNPQLILPGQTTENETFSGDYSPKTIIGTSRITYVFFDNDNPDDSVGVVVEYKASPAGIGEDFISSVKFSAVYPNPAASVAYVDYSIPESVNKASIIITNMLGNKVKEVNLNDRSGKARIAVSDLMNGIYFYSLRADDQLLSTKKFVVKR